MSGESKNVNGENSSIGFLMRFHRRLLVFTIFYFVFQFVPLSIYFISSFSFLPQLEFVLLLIMNLSFLPLLVYQLILSRGSGGIMYYAHAINMLCMLYVFHNMAASNTSIYTYSDGFYPVLFLIFIHPAPLMLVFATIGYLLSKALSKSAIDYRLVFIIWVLGPILYIVTLIPVLQITITEYLTGPIYITTYNRSPLPLQLGFLVWFFYYAVPGPFISLATLPKYFAENKTEH